jgi:hypothetical protein
VPGILSPSKITVKGAPAARRLLHNRRPLSNDLARQVLGAYRKDGSERARSSKRWDAGLMGKRPSFIEVTTNRLSFLADDHGFAGPEIERFNPDRMPTITHVCYHRNDVTIEVIHVVGFMGENYVETRCRHKDENGEGDRMTLGNNTTHTGYQLRRAVDLQAQAIRSHLGLS